MAKMRKLTQKDDKAKQGLRKIPFLGESYGISRWREKKRIREEEEGRRKKKKRRKSKGI